MLLEWLYRTTLELSVLIGLVLLLRSIVRRALGAGVAYLLWFLPLFRAVLIERPQRPQVLIESLGPAAGQLDVLPAPASWAVPGAIPWAALWLSGASIWIALKLLAWIRFRAMLDAAAEPIEMPVSLAAAMPVSVAHRARFFACELPGTPFVTGLLKPRIWLPADFAERFEPRQQTWMIQHELMHLARNDLWMQLAWECLRAAFWFNPLVHIAARAASRSGASLRSSDRRCLRCRCEIELWQDTDRLRRGGLASGIRIVLRPPQGTHRDDCKTPSLEGPAGDRCGAMRRARCLHADEPIPRDCRARNGPADHGKLHRARHSRDLSAAR